MIKNRYTKAAACAVLAVSMIFTGCGKKESTKTADKQKQFVLKEEILRQIHM